MAENDQVFMASWPAQLSCHDLKTPQPERTISDFLHYERRIELHRNYQESWQ